jgi:hypothetical protein
MLLQLIFRPEGAKQILCKASAVADANPYTFGMPLQGGN